MSTARVWYPFTNNVLNQGTSNVQISSNQVSRLTATTGGKLGNNCYKTQLGSNNNGTAVSLQSDIAKANTSSLSICGWFKFDYSEIKTILDGLTYGGNTDVYYAIGILFGRGNSTTSGGFGLVWRSNGHSTDFNTLYVQAYLRTPTVGNKAIGGTGVIIPTNKWTHICEVFDRENLTLKEYINGELVGTLSIPTFSDMTSGTFTTNYRSVPFGDGPASNLPYCMNDLRIYYDALSDLEVKELSQGLVLHYPLDQTAGDLLFNNTYPTFENDSAGGGWSHWTGAGTGTFGQNTDKNYIYNKNQKYSHWFAYPSDGTYTNGYLCYQSPSFSGGYRSIQAIIKEENGLPITESICFPTWNARSGGVTANHWTSIQSLGNGFYLCKTEGLMQDGSNNLVGIYVKAGYKVYLSCFYIQNDVQNCTFDCSNIKTEISDVSGYNTNGMPLRILNLSNDTIKYSKSLHFYTEESGIYFIDTNNLLNIFNNQWTVSFWAKATNRDGSRIIYFGSYMQIPFINIEKTDTNALTFRYKISSDGDSVDFVGNTQKILDGNWYHICLTSSSLSDLKMYINGTLDKTFTTTRPTLSFSTNTYWYVGRDARGAGQIDFRGNMSDFRIYSTALNEEDILSLYKVGARIDNSNNYHASELYENDSNNLVTGVTAGGQMTKTGMLELTSSGTNADTYFIINLSESIVVGTTYKLTCMCSGFADDTQYLRFPIGGQNNTSQVIDIKNGYNEKVFTANEWNYGANRILMDDNGGTRTNVLKINGFSLIKLNSDNTKISIGRNGVTQGDLFVEYSNNKTQFFASNTVLAKEFVEI